METVSHISELKVDHFIHYITFDKHTINLLSNWFLLVKKYEKFSLFRSNLLGLSLNSKLINKTLDRCISFYFNLDVRARILPNFFHVTVNTLKADLLRTTDAFLKAQCSCIIVQISGKIV